MGVYGQAELTLSVVVERPRMARTFARQGRKRDKTTAAGPRGIRMKGRHRAVPEQNGARTGKQEKNPRFSPYLH